ncbi:MAG: transposase zinc-binding domain-containing protein, partial [Desulfosalsimonas sp.]
MSSPTGPYRSTAPWMQPTTSREAIMNRPRYEVADVFRQYGEAYCRKYSLSPEQLSVFNLIKICRTSVLGGHLEKCDHCSFERPAYNSCRNRHCPK